MQMGIISFEPIRKGKATTIDMGLIDYKTKADSPALVISWQLIDDKWAHPVVETVTIDIKRLSEVGKIATAVDKLKAKNKNALTDPAVLLHLLQKQLGRHVHHTGSEWQLVPKSVKDNLWTEPVLNLTAQASDEETAKTKLSKELGVQIQSNLSKMDDYVEWLKNGTPVKEVKEALDDIPPLTVYSRKSVDTKA